MNNQIEKKFYANLFYSLKAHIVGYTDNNLPQFLQFNWIWAKLAEKKILEVTIASPSPPQLYGVTHLQVALIRSKSCVSGRQEVFLGVEDLVELDGKTGEAVVQRVIVRQSWNYFFAAVFNPASTAKTRLRYRS